ncbi:importin alpha, putative [Entamoeba histolytica HM-1:IMSS-B]|uniref:Importin alpha, putative n=6 Tax=Entamoeba histolytica TaxID=5759 RepID=C4M322_ENTH1|nr:importin alpha, putative [Entamoeba histolytica HM-1:IMSS]EMD46714.1 importin subunit alpha7, putative [Entamoeba histolytica KU27]EMH74278.1 importin alpha, putative [Entamoeba histolytica HM-1:IMSS-B]EMS13706.1 importin subunit alpha-7, putative [Entamoeba histolytica HM-3:IMSS]ENY65501.1 importin subunit alpha-7, putative [Entamoeba histolytica HM-1:IMSS-A]GAT95697.1 importin alpha putative [Entamoeba histolytica]|eukprot:XP_652945.1 importin alpha, putative [Entamoeba histolytica HM-1:IMSS]
MSFRSSDLQLQQQCQQRHSEIGQLRAQKRSQIMNQKRRKIDFEPRKDGLIPIEEMQNLCYEVINGNTNCLMRLLETLSNDPVPYQIIKSTGTIKTIIKNLKSDNNDIIFYSLSILINYSAFSPENSNEICQQGISLYFEYLINANDERIVMHLLWLMANIASDGVIPSEIIINSGIIQYFPSVLQRFPTLRTRSQIMWLFCSLVRRSENKQIDSNFIQVVIQFAMSCFEYSTNDNDELISDACWTLQYIALIPEQFKLVLTKQVIEKMLYCCRSSEIKIAVPSIRFFGNLLTYDDEIAKQLITQLLPILIYLNDSIDPSILKELYYAISNITACKDISLLQLILDSKLLYNIPILVIQRDVSKMAREEMEWTLSNFCFGATNQMLQTLLTNCPAVIAALFSICTEQSLPSQLLIITLKSIRNVCRFCDDNKVSINDVAEEFQFETVLEDIIINEPNKRIKELATNLLENYFREPEMML